MDHDGRLASLVSLFHTHTCYTQVKLFTRNSSGKGTKEVYGTVQHFVVRSAVAADVFEGDGDVVFTRCVCVCVWADVSAYTCTCTCAYAHLSSLFPSPTTRFSPPLSHKKHAHTYRHPTAVYGTTPYSEPLRTLVYDKSRVEEETWQAVEELEV